MRELNIINKVVTFILIAVSLYINYNDIYIYVLSCIGIICLFNYKSLWWSGLFIFPIVGVLCDFNFDYIGIDVNKLYYLSIMIGTLIIVIKSLTIDEKRYIFDNTIYKSRDFRKTRRYLDKWYYEKKFEENMNNSKKYNSLVNSKELIHNAHLKTKKDLDDIYVLNRIRFYQLYGTKRTFFPDSWKKYDTLYLVIILIVFGLIML